MDDFSGIKKEDLEKLAKQYLGSEKAITIGLLPTEKQGT
jgi:zinc protease